MTLSHYEYIKTEIFFVVNIHLENSGIRSMRIGKETPLSGVRERGWYVAENGGPLRG